MRWSMLQVSDLRTPAAPAQLQGPTSGGPFTQTLLRLQGNLSASTTNASQLYTLSVNRLAPQQHAQLAALNASVNGSDFTLCSDGSTLAAVPVLDAATGTGSPTSLCPDSANSILVIQYSMRYANPAAQLRQGQEPYRSVTSVASPVQHITGCLVPGCQ